MLFNNTKICKSSNLIGKGKYIEKVVDKRLKKSMWSLKGKSCEQDYNHSN